MECGCWRRCGRRWPTQAVADELHWLEGEMSRLRRLVGNLLDMVEERVCRKVKERLNGA